LPEGGEVDAFGGMAKVQFPKPWQKGRPQMNVSAPTAGRGEAMTSTKTFGNFLVVQGGFMVAGWIYNGITTRILSGHCILNERVQYHHKNTG
jgi:hypothetical protein